MICMSEKLGGGSAREALEATSLARYLGAMLAMLIVVSGIAQAEPAFSVDVTRVADVDHPDQLLRRAETRCLDQDEQMAEVLAARAKRCLAPVIRIAMAVTIFPA
jgi:hypothetical protein